MVKFLISKHAEAYCFSVRVCTLLFPALQFPILQFSQPSHVQHSCAAGRWRAPRQKKAVKNNSRSWQKKVMVKGSNGRIGILPRVSVRHMDNSRAQEWHTWAEEKKKWAAQTQRSLSSPPPCTWGSGPFSSRHRLSASPRNGESEQDVCNSHGNWKQKKNKKRNFPACTLQWRAFILRSRESSF